MDVQYSCRQNVTLMSTLSSILVICGVLMLSVPVAIWGRAAWVHTDLCLRLAAASPDQNKGIQDAIKSVGTMAFNKTLIGFVSGGAISSMGGLALQFMKFHSH